MRYLFFLFGFLLFISCSEEDTVSHSQGMVFLKDTHTILQINKKNEFISAIDNNLFWKEYMPSLPDTSVKEVLRSLPDSLTYWVTYTDKNLYILSSETQKDTVSHWQPETNQFFSKEINGKKWYYKRIENRLIISTNTNLSDILKTSAVPMPQVLEKLKTTIDSKVSANLFMKKDISEQFFRPIFEWDITQNFEDWTAIDLVMDKKSVKLNGTSLIQAKDSIAQDFVRPTAFYDNHWEEITPANISQVRSYSLTEPSDSLPENSFSDVFHSLTIMKLQSHTFWALGLSDANEIVKQIPILNEEVFEEQTIYRLSANDDTFYSFLNHFDTKFSPAYAMIYQNFLILSSEISVLKQLVEDYQKNSVLSATSSFRSLTRQMASSANETFIASLSNNQSFKESYPKIAKNFALASLQVSSINEFYILNFISEETTDLISSDAPKERFTTILEDTLISPPTIVLNHRTKQKEIILQNAKNELVLIGNNGAILFKTPLDSAINSPIYQVDLFKNGYLQYAFTTQNSIWVIDRNGNRVAPYPKKYKGSLSPLEVYDYEGNRDYRFMTIEDKTIFHLLNGRGNPVEGFTKSKAESPVLQTPKHFKINSKDYLVYPTEKGILKILHRDGRVRVPVTEKFDFSENPVIVSKDNFSFTTSHGKIVNVNTLGNIQYNQTDTLSPQHYRNAYKGFEVRLSGTTLKIGDNYIELPEGEYHNPKIHKIGNRFLVSIFDSLGQKVFLYDQEGMPMPHFPINTLSDIDIRLSSDNKLLLVITPERNKVSLYELD